MKWGMIGISFATVVFVKLVFGIEMVTAVAVVILVQVAWLAGELYSLRQVLDRKLIPRLKNVQDEALTYHRTLRDLLVAVRDYVEDSPPPGPSEAEV